MVQGIQGQNRQQIQKALKRGAKAVLMSRGMNPSTRRGNKELENLLNQLGRKSYASVEDAIRMGEALGWEIVKLSEKRNQKNLDASVIRQVAESGNLLSELTPNSDGAQQHIESLTSEISVNIDMKQGASPIEKTPTVTVTGQEGNAASETTESQTVKVKSEPVVAEDDDFAATTADLESDPPLPTSVSEAVAAVSPPRQPDGAEMDSEAEEEPAAVDADTVEDLQSATLASTSPGDAEGQGTSNDDSDLGLSVASKGTEGVEDLDEDENNESEDFVEESVSVASKLSGEETEIASARK
ncbi:MAG TPA: hypothetical protein V6D29_16395 [Leptolyngbyaceae cyanobacterium]